MKYRELHSFFLSVISALLMSIMALRPVVVVLFNNSRCRSEKGQSKLITLNRSGNCSYLFSLKACPGWCQVEFETSDCAISGQCPHA